MKAEEITLLILLLNINTGCFSLQCHYSEYLVGDYCCPTCPPGKHVKTDCTLTRSTSCSSCEGATFMDQQNGFKHCVPCKVCDTASGLRVKTPCSGTSDSVCEPLEGFYCVDSSGGKCAAAKKHSSCQAGQYISKNGSLYEDTECRECSDGSFSTTGSSSWCQPHTQCESINQKLIQPGCSSADAQCAPVDHRGVIVGVTLPIVMAFTAGVLYCLYRRRKPREEENRKEEKKNKNDQQERNTKKAPKSTEPLLEDNTDPGVHSRDVYVDIDQTTPTKKKTQLPTVTQQSIN